MSGAVWSVIFILIFTSLFLALTWLFLNGWLQVKAYNLINVDKSCSYADVGGDYITKSLPPFKNVKVEVGKNSFLIKVDLLFNNSHQIIFGKNARDYISYTISDDTLYLKMKNERNNLYAVVGISLPVLSSVNMAWSPKLPLKSNRYGVYTTINGFTGNKLFINNSVKNDINLLDNKLHKLELRGNYDDSKIAVLDYNDYDSLDFDINASRLGSLNFVNSDNKLIKENPKQYINIKVPASFRIEAGASLASKIIIKK